MSYPFETQPSKFALCRGLARYLKEKGDAMADEIERIGNEELRKVLPWWVNIPADIWEWFARRCTLDYLASIASMGVIVNSILVLWRGPIMIVAAIYCGVLYAMIRLDQIRDNKPVYITPMDDEEENGEVQS